MFNEVSPSHVRWHYRNFLSPNEGLTPHQVVQAIGQLDSEAERLKLKVSLRLKEFKDQALLYEEDVGQLVFGTENPTPAELLAVHRTLHSLHPRVIRKDRGWRVGGPYSWRPDMELLSELEHLVESEFKANVQFRSRAMGVLFESKPVPEWTEMERTFLRGLQVYASLSHLDASQKTKSSNPWEPIAQSLTLGLCPCEPAEVWRILQRLGEIPTLYDPIFYQSGLRHEQRPSPTTVLVPASDEAAREVVEEEVFAIDAATTVEVDDAISFSDDWLHVHISDPASSIGPNDPFDRWIRERASSIYMPMERVAMMPRECSDVHSLMPERPNRALTFSARLSEDGDLLDMKIRPTVLTNVKRLTYEAADLHDDLVAKLPMLEKHLKWRIQQGHLSLDIPRVPVHHSTATGMLELKPDKHEGSSHLLVSESMILAGRIAAKWAQEHRLQAPFRYHTEPVDQQVVKLVDKIRSEPYSLSDRVRLMLSLPSAAVDLQPRRHWSMGLDCYAKATSPLRRYMDLLLHQQLHRTLATGKLLPNHYWEPDMLVSAMVYRREMYIKQMQRASNRHWILRYLAELPKSTVLNAVIIDHSNYSNLTSLWLQEAGILLPSRVSGLPTHIQQGDPMVVRLVGVDVMKGIIEVERI